MINFIDLFNAVSKTSRPFHFRNAVATSMSDSLLLLDDMKNGFVPAIENRTETDLIFLSHKTPSPDGLILSLAAGMGNIYSAAIFREL